MVRLPAKITGLDVTRYRDTVNALIDCVAAMRIVPDNKTIRANQTNNGITISAISQGIAVGDSAPAAATETEYADTFKVESYVDDADGIAKASIYDGGNKAGSYAGYWRHGVGRVAVVKKIGLAYGSLSGPRDNYVYLKISWTGSVYVFEFKVGEIEVPSTATWGFVCVPLALVTGISSGKITRLRQLHLGGDVLTPGVV